LSQAFSRVWRICQSFFPHPARIQNSFFFGDITVLPLHCANCHKENKMGICGVLQKIIISTITAKPY